MKRKTSLLHRVVAMVLTVIMIATVIPSSMIPTFALNESDASLGTLTAITTGGNVTDGNGADATVSYNTDSFVLGWSPADPSIGRNTDGWWIGIKMTAPSNMTKAEHFENVVYQTKGADGWSANKSFWAAQDSDKNAEDTERYLTMWGVVNEEYLNTALINNTTVNYAWQFDWNGDGTFEQTANLKVDPTKVKLSKDGIQVYPSATGTVEVLSEGLAVQGTNNGNVVNVQYDTNQILQWVKADTSIGRMSDGWWSGIKIIAPEGMTTSNDFTNVTYQTLTTDGWSADKSFWNAQDSDKNATDTARYLTMWGLLNKTYLADAVAKQKVLTYSWRFDWNGDGVYEQVVVLKIDPAKITLNNKSGEQVYPELGDVTPIHQGTVTGPTGNKVVTSTELTLDWEAKNPAIGRNEDGWWTGIKVVAPSDLTATELEKAKLQQIRFGETSWGPEISFWSNKTSSDSDATHYIRMWMNLTPKKLEAAQNAEENITHQYQFDWDGDGTYDQHITVVVVPSENIVLTKVDQQADFKFEDATPANQWIGKTYTNIASGGAGDGDVTYSIVSGSEYASVDPKTGKVIFTVNAVGRPVTVKAIKAADDVYAQAEATYTVTAVKDDYEHEWTILVPGAITYAEGLVFKNPVIDAEQSVVSGFEYTIVAENDCASVNPTTGDVTVKKAGTATITATLAESDWYNEEVLTYTLTINPANQTPLSFTNKPASEPWEVTYSPNPFTTLLELDGGNGIGAVTYTVTTLDGKTSDVAKITPDRVLRILKAGSFKIKVTKAADDCYNETSVEAEIVVKKANQEGFKFEHDEMTVTYNQNEGNLVQNDANGGSGTGDVTYEISIGNEYVEFNENNTKSILKIIAAGNKDAIIIKATKAADDCYNEATATYSLKINKAEQSFEFEHGKTISELYGIKSYLNPVVMNEITDTEVAADGKGYGTGAITYSITSTNVIGASIDAETGELTFTDSEAKAGTITVEAVKAADSCYNEYRAEYTFDVDYLATPANPYVLSGETKNDSGWYTGEVTIEAPDGYVISYDNELSTNDWASSVKHVKEGDNSATVYLKDADGHITDAIVIGSIKMDTQDPQAVSITYNTPFAEKVKESLSFGIYKAQLKVTVTAKDPIPGSGIALLKVDKGNGYEDVKDFTKVEDEDGTVNYIFTILPEYRDIISMYATDVSGREAKVLTDGRTIVIDTTDPTLEVGYEYFSGEYREYNEILYTKGDTTVNFWITEANFDLSLENGGTPVVTINGNEVVLTWEFNEEKNRWESKTTISGEGEYVINLTYTDVVEREVIYEKELHIDNTPADMSVTYDNNTVFNEKYYAAERKPTFTIVEDNFEPKELVVKVDATDVQGNPVDTVKVAEYQAYLQDINNWDKDQSGDIIKYTTKECPAFEEDAIYDITIEYTDLARNEANKLVQHFVVDKTKPENLTISYSKTYGNPWEEVLNTITLGLYAYKEKMEVTITADDLTSGIDYFAWTYTKQEGASPVNVFKEEEIIDGKSEVTGKAEDITYTNDGKTATAKFILEATDVEQYRGSISIKAVDKSTNFEIYSDDKRINIVDTIKPERLSIQYTPGLVCDAQTLEVKDSYVEGDDVISYYEYETTATLLIKEANFYEEDVKIYVRKDGVETQLSADSVQWEPAKFADTYIGTFTLSGNGDYYVRVEYTDRSDNVMDTYKSHMIVIDDIAPTIDVTYDPEAPVINDENPDDGDKNEKYYKTSRKATIKITEHNFRADDVIVTVTANDVTGTDINNVEEIQKQFQDYLSEHFNWTEVEEDVHMAEITFVDDAQYTFQIQYTDIVGNGKDKSEDGKVEVTTYDAPEFVVDHKEPTNLTIKYSEKIKFWPQLLESVTLGLYSYNPTVIVTMTAEDITSGVDYFKWTYTKQNGASEVNHSETKEDIISKKLEPGAEPQLNAISYSLDGKTATAMFELTAKEAEQYRGYISCVVTDRAGNDSSVADSKRINVVDTISPTRVVTYTEANQVVDASTLRTLEQYNYAGENTNVILYYNDSVTATFTITEANFYKEDVVIKVNGVAQTVTNWIQNGDVWTASLTLSAEGDYIVTMDYTDRSLNVMNTYTSQKIVIDKTLPVITVDYANKDIKNTVRDSEGHNRNYYDAVQTATITIKEHNFRPDDVVVRVTAKNVIGQDVAVSDYAALALRRAEWEKVTPYEASWRRENDTYKLVIQYPVDANYTFDIEYTDLATNEASDYPEDYFTVDKTVPTNLNTSYSTSILEKVLQTVTFGYYNALVTVTIQAEDETSGIYQFMYSYLKSANVSQVNAELIDQAIRDAQITYSGKTATATFTIPERVLSDNNQFNGTVEFTAYDRAENNTEEADDVRVVVDNINPVATVTYNEPVQSANNISYYAGVINATVAIHEANFYAEDVIISVTKDGASIPVSVNWTNNSVDVHTGTFTLTQDGAYYVNITYKDRSANEMSAYLSNELTIDTKAPSIEVSQIKMNSANKDEVYGFTITASDTTYLDTSTFAPVLKAVLRGEDGTYKTETISLGDMQTVVNGQTYAFIVENLTQDAVYSLTCVVKDMAGNEISQLLLSEEDEVYEDVKFSVNREGSTYSINETTDKLINTYYVQSVGSDVVIEEVNVDPVETYVVKLNGQKLKEGTDYTTTLENEEGKWSKRTYVINKALFEEEGEYNIVVESTDKTNTVAYSDVKAVKIAFVVDQTKPVLTISGLEENGNYEAETQEVVVIPTDDGGRLSSLEVVLMDSDGNFVKTLYKLEGEELLADISEDGEIRFKIPEGVRHQIQIICNDCALNEDEETNEYNEVFKAVTVSPNKFLIAFLDFYYNKLAFCGSITGTLVLIAAIIAFIVFKKKKKEEQK